MIDIAVNELNKYYGSNHVIRGISFDINSGEKVGLLGKNGSGKTTLFKAITGEEHYESGSISKASGKKVEMLAQIPEFGGNDTSEDVLRSSFAETNTIFNAMKKIESNTDPAAFDKYGHLMEEYERLGGYETEVRLDKVCGGMNIDDRLRNSLFNQLSGGERARVNLAHILLRDCDILLLDEPTNHLDLTSLEWLEGFLQNFPGTVIVVSHDRVFLDRVVTRIIEIDDGKANFYSGNYSFYAEEREQRFLTQAEQYKQQQRKISQLEAAVKRQRIWAQINPSNTGLAKRALAMEKRIERMDKVEKPIAARKLDAEFNSGGYASKEIVSFDSVCKSYGEQIIAYDLEHKILRNDRIAIAGANGCGKTTLLKMMMGEEHPDSGGIRISPNVKIGYMSQIIVFDDINATVLDVLCAETGETAEKARSILARFHFFASDVTKKVSVLSGGEKSRLKLCLMMQKNINFLLLDEPTNHLDIASREWIENALTDFEGTMLFVSHDRYFLYKFAEKIWSMKNGVITQHNCGIEEYTEDLRNSARTSPKSDSKKRKASKTKAVLPKSTAVSIETQIAELELELDGINADIEADLIAADFEKIKALCAKKNQLDEQIEALYSKWVDTEGAK